LRYLFIILSLFAFTPLFSQKKKDIFGNEIKESLPLDKHYKSYYKTPAKFDSVSEATVTLVHRVWRVIDMKEKGNQQLFGTSVPKKHYCTMFDILCYGINSDKTYAYKDDEFGSKSKSKRYKPDELFKTMVSKDSVEERYIDEVTGEDIIHTVLKQDTVKSSQIVQYWIKEDWYYNQHNAALEKQVISFCPVVLDEKKHKYRPLFWVYYPECRDLLSSFEAFYPVSTGERFTYDELIIKRSFNSYLIKETNVFERKGSSESTGINLLIESERSKEKYIRKEGNLWEY
jgi:gliding motility associated protien GldN